MTSKPQAAISEAHLLDDDDVPACPTTRLVNGSTNAITTAVQPPLSSRPSSIGAASTVSVRGRHAKRMTLNFPIVLPEIPSSPASPSEEPDENKENVARQSNNIERRASLRDNLTSRLREESAKKSPSLSSPSASPSASASTPMLFGKRSAASSSAAAAARSRSATGGLGIGKGLEFDNPYEFLTLMAAQERKVMELKEELQRAESELSSLKRRWSVNERSRKTSEFIYHTEPMTTFHDNNGTKHGSGSVSGRVGDDLVSGSLIDEEDTSPGTPKSHHSGRLNRELLQRDRASSVGQVSRTSPDNTGFMISPIRSKPRTVFNGSRHQRNLSLVESLGTRDRSSSVSQPTNSANAERSSSASPSGHQPLQPTKLSRSSTLPSSMNTTTPSSAQSPNATTPRGSMLKTGQQMMLDVKDNIWMLFEEVKNAAAVDDVTLQGQSNAEQLRGKQFGLAHPASLRQSSTSTVRKSKDHDPSAFWRQFGLDAPEASASASASTTNTNTNMNTGTEANLQTTSKSPQVADEGTLLDFDSWDVWDPPLDQENHNKHWQATPTSSKGRGASNPNNHTPSSSISTNQSKRGEQSSPSTASSSPPMSASFAEPTSPAEGPRAVVHVSKSRKPNNTYAHHALPSPSLTASRDSSAKFNNDNIPTDTHNRNLSNASNSTSRSSSGNITASLNGDSSSIPWPTLVKDLASPSKLARTASSMLAEWDVKSPPPPSPSLFLTERHHKNPVSSHARSDSAPTTTTTSSSSSANKCIKSD